eukprot:1098816-Prymnesium_polylepis.1
MARFGLKGRDYDTRVSSRFECSPLRVRAVSQWPQIRPLKDFSGNRSAKTMVLCFRLTVEGPFDFWTWTIHTRVAENPSCHHPVILQVAALTLDNASNTP